MLNNQAPNLQVQAEPSPWKISRRWRWNATRHWLSPRPTFALPKGQRYRVLNAVELSYTEALGAQQLVELRTELAKIARDAAVTSKQLFNVGQADQPDVIEASVEAQRVELDLLAAQHDQQRVWQQ